MEQELQDVEHYARIIAGCESINNVVTNGGQLTEDGRYAQSVLRIHAQDELGAFAGNESVGSAIKTGAANVVKWIKGFIASIVNMLKSISNSISKPKYDEAVKQMRNESIRKEIEDEFVAAHKAYVPSIESAINKVKEANANKSEALGSVNDLNGVIAILEKTKKGAEDCSEGFSKDLWTAKTLITTAIEHGNRALESYATKEGKKDADLTKGTVNIKNLSYALSQISKVTDRFIKDAGRLYTRSVQAADLAAMDKRKDKK